MMEQKIKAVTDEKAQPIQEFWVTFVCAIVSAVGIILVIAGVAKAIQSPFNGVVLAVFGVWITSMGVSLDNQQKVHTQILDQIKTTNENENQN